MDLHKMFVEQAPYSMAMFDKNMRFLIASNQWRKDFELQDLPIIGVSFYEVFPDTTQDRKDIHEFCLGGGISDWSEGRFLLSNGNEIWISWKTIPWFDSDDNIGGIIIYTNTLTEKKQLEDALNIQEQQFRGAFETSSIGMAIVGLNGEWLKVNNSLLRIFDYDRESLSRLGFQDLSHPIDLRQDLELVRELIEGNREHYQMEKRYFRRDGSIVWVLLSVSIVRDLQNRPLHFISQLFDITESKLMGQLRISNADKRNGQIANTLHENIAQSLASIKMMVTGFKEANPQLQPEIELINQKMNTLIKEVKNLTVQFAPTTFVYEELESMLVHLKNKYSYQSPISIKIRIAAPVRKLSYPYNYYIYNLADDLLAVCAKKRASHIALEFTRDHTVVITCTDDGKYPTDEVEAREIKILINDLTLRLEMLDGRIRLPHSYENPTVSLRIPIS